MFEFRKINLLYPCLIVVLFGLFSCEDVIDLPLENSNPRLVIQANIIKQGQLDESNQEILLSYTSDFYQGDFVPASGAMIKVVNDQGTEFVFTESNNSPGTYRCFNFNILPNSIYTLSVNINGNNYSAQEQYFQAPQITESKQRLVELFGNESVEVKYFFNDPINESNFYLFEFNNLSDNIKSYDVLDDELFAEPTMFGIFFESDLNQGDQIKFTLHGISHNYYKYMRKLIELASNDQGGGPFETPKSNVRGNIVNQTNPDQYPLGYFRISQTNEFIHLIE